MWVNAQGIRRIRWIWIFEAWHWTRDVRQPRGGRGTGILYGCCKDGTLEGALSFAIVVEAEFVDRCVADRPRVADVPLLKPLVDNGPETGHIRARSLELREWGNLVVIVVIIIKAEILLTVKAVVQPQRSLVATLGLHRRSHKFVAVVGW